MIWSKMKQQLESFISPALAGRVEYRASSYRYRADKAGHCYLSVDKKEIFSMSEANAEIRWFKTEQEIKNDPDIQIPVSVDDIEAVRTSMKGNVPEERLAVIARDRKIADYAKEMLAAQAALSKSDFNAAANTFMSLSIEECLDSKDILLNVFALIDRRLGKKRILGMEEKMKLKHPAVQYFYELRRSTL
ncbi:MAG: hypothetical protein H6Q58_1188 [Firmicutes bacterium]|nr:hypothetical protein [Bacillota bacterium]